MKKNQELLIGGLLVVVGLLFCYWAFVDPGSAPPYSRAGGVGNAIERLGGYPVFGVLSVLLGGWRVYSATKKK